MITIKDVAKRAGVSISTVSRVINNSKPVSDDIRKRVEAVIKETKYVPNPVARSLVMKSNRFIGVIVSDLSDSRMGIYLSGMEEIAVMYGYDLLLCNSYGESEREEKYIKLLQSKQVAGLVMIRDKIDSDIIKLVKESGLETVYIGKNSDKFDIMSAGFDEKGASYDMVEFLIKKGHRNIVLFTRNKDRRSDFISGYKEALNNHDISFNEKNIILCKKGFSGGYEATLDIIEKNNIPDAIFAYSVEVAIGILAAFFVKGYNVPDDVSVAGYTDVSLAYAVRPALTTVHYPLYDIGAVSVRSLIKTLNGEEQHSGSIKLPYSIIERQSVKGRV